MPMQGKVYEGFSIREEAAGHDTLRNKGQLQAC